MTVGIIIQTRTGSTRLPAKVMMRADDEFLMIDYIINQLQHSKLSNKMVIATTDLDQDDVIYEHVTNRNIPCFRGDEKMYFKDITNVQKNIHFQQLFEYLVINL